MDLENELRQAMAEHVSGVSVSRTLAHDARRRHQRTVRRRATLAMTAAGIVVAVATVPAYHAIRPQPVGSRGPETRHGTDHETASTATARPQVPAGASSSPSKNPADPSRHVTTPSQRPADGHETIPDAAKRLLGYLPHGIDPKDDCHTEQAGQRKITICRWTGSAGRIEVRLIHDSTLTSPADIGLAPAVPEHVRVQGHPALRGGGPAALSQVMWVEHKGLGVWVGVSPALSDRLLRIADGVRVS